MEKTKTVVNIAGKDYTIVGAESAEYIHRVALKVNSKYKEIKMANPDLNNVQLAMLTAINMADEYTKMKDDIEVIKKELDSIKRSKPQNVQGGSSIILKK